MLPAVLPGPLLTAEMVEAFPGHWYASDDCKDHDLATVLWAVGEGLKDQPSLLVLLGILLLLV